MAEDKNNKDSKWLYDQDELDLNKVASATDLTGLMQTPALSDEEVDSYNDIYTIPKKDSNPNHNERPLNKKGNVDPYDIALRKNGLL